MSFSFSRPELNGSVAPYFPMPIFVLDALLKDNNLTESAKMMYIKLYSFVAFNEAKRGKKSLFVSVPYLAELTGYSSRTIKRNLKELRDNNYLKDNELSVDPLIELVSNCADPIVVKRSKADHLIIGDETYDDSNSEVLKKTNQETSIPSKPLISSNIDMNTDVETIANQTLAMLGIKKTIKLNPESQNDFELKTPTDSCSSSEANLSSKMTDMSQNMRKKVTNVSPILTNQILNKEKETNHITSSTSKEQNTAKITPSAENQSKLSYREKRYFVSALQRMNISDSMQDQYFKEINYSLSQGTLSTWNKMKAIRTCLKLIESKSWNHPYGMYVVPTPSNNSRKITHGKAIA